MGIERASAELRMVIDRNRIFLMIELNQGSACKAQNFAYQKPQNLSHPAKP